MTNAVDGVAAGQVFWLPNTGFRDTTGPTYTTYLPSQAGFCWAFNQVSDTIAYSLFFYSSQSAGALDAGAPKLRALPIRCVRLIGLYE